MKQKLSLLIVLLTVAALLAACGGGAATPAVSQPAAGQSQAAPPAGKPNTLTAVKTDAASLDAGAASWAKAPVLTFTTKSTKEGGPDGPTVSAQAVYDANNIAIRLEWPDTTNSNVNKPWVWDGSTFTRTTDLGDRMGVLFPIGNIPEFSSKGCTGACHNSDADRAKWWMGTESADQRYDLWQWTAASSNPVGQAQDEWMSNLEDPADVESATHGDALTSGGSVSNVNAATDGPAYMNGTDIKSSFIITGEQVAIDTSKFTSGAVVPPSVLAPWVGSRGDVQAKGVWQDGKWVVVLMRALNTGNDDDLAMTPPKPYPLGVAVFDHIDLEGHTTSPEAITLEWQQ